MGAVWGLWNLPNIPVDSERPAQTTAQTPALNAAHHSALMDISTIRFASSTVSNGEPASGDRNTRQYTPSIETSA